MTVNLDPFILEGKKNKKHFSVTSIIPTQTTSQKCVMHISGYVVQEQSILKQHLVNTSVQKLPQMFSIKSWTPSLIAESHFIGNTAFKSQL